MIRSIAWKNIWRNKLRSLVILSAIALGLLAGIFSVAMMGGMVNERIENVIHNELSHLQIHNKKFLQNDEIRYTIPETSKIINTLDTIPEVLATAARLRMNGMANTSGNNTGVIILGVHPEQEKSVFNIHENILENTGSFFEE
ncbi:MAG: ABC transporter permease, partial [Bacteroidota bacterium]